MPCPPYTAIVHWGILAAPGRYMRISCDERGRCSDDNSGACGHVDDNAVNNQWKLRRSEDTVGENKKTDNAQPPTTYRRHTQVTPEEDKNCSTLPATSKVSPCHRPEINVPAKDVSATKTSQNLPPHKYATAETCLRRRRLRKNKCQRNRHPATVQNRCSAAVHDTGPIGRQPLASQNTKPRDKVVGHKQSHATVRLGAATGFSANESTKGSCKAHAGDRG